MKYFQMAGAEFKQRGQLVGTLEHGEEGDDSAATLYEYFTFIRHPQDNF
jgi:hypothetical protein